MLGDLLEKVKRGEEISREEAVELLNISNTSDEFCDLVDAADGMSRERYQKRGYVFAQIGINAAPCSGNCGFCSFAKDHYAVGKEFERSIEEVVAQAEVFARENIYALFLMSTADFDQEKFLLVGEAVKAVLPDGMQLVANIGDFDSGYAARLKAVGFTGAYHIVRLREGIDTDIKKETRIATLDAIKSAGLDLYYCVEPIGQEHTYDEMADEMIRAREYGVEAMAVMRRVGVKGTPFENVPDVSDLELMKIAAVTRIVNNPKMSMGVHEPQKIPLLAGVNQLYAESGTNPRDTEAETEGNRGYDVPRVTEMLLDAGYIV